MRKEGKNRQSTAFIVSAALALVLLLGLPVLFDAVREKGEQEEEMMSGFLSGPLRERMEADSLIVAASVSLLECGSGNTPHSALLARFGDKKEIRNIAYDIDRVPVVPGGMMQAPTLTFFMDRKFTHPVRKIPTRHGIIPEIPEDSEIHQDSHILSYEMTTGKDSISVEEGFLMSSRYVAARIALDNEWYWREYIDRFVDYFGASDAYYVPRMWDRFLFRDEYVSVVDGHGLHLSQGQILTFYDAIANGGVRARHRYLRRRSVCSVETADGMKALLRENVLSGTGVLLSSHPARIAGKTGSGILRHGYVPGLVRSSVPEPVSVSSFVGFFPVEDPQYTMIVTFYFRSGGQPAGAAVPMRVFGEITGKMMEEGMLWKK